MYILEVVSVDTDELVAGCQPDMTRAQPECNQSAVCLECSFCIFVQYAVSICLVPDEPVIIDCPQVSALEDHIAQSGQIIAVDSACIGNPFPCLVTVDGNGPVARKPYDSFSVLSYFGVCLGA